MKKIYLNLKDAINLIEEADVLLFRGKSFISRMIQRSGEGEYSHAALATFPKCLQCPEDREILEVSEFREGKGGRTVSITGAYSKDIEAGIIDVYRVINPLVKVFFDEKDGKIKESLQMFNPRGITNEMRKATGLPYGWDKIWWILKKKIFGLRLFHSLEKSSDDAIIKSMKDVYPVCSTAVAYCYSKYGYDLVPNRADSYTEPSDLARSAILSYLFTIKG